ncbi:MAG: TonB-dependent siderophore receptor [Opitutaceae bacterium]
MHAFRFPPRASAKPLLLLLLLSVAGLPAGAQTAPALPPSAGSTPDETVALQAFEVVSSSDVGYRAANSISGSRIAVPIQDTPMSLEVMNQELISDTAAFDLRNMLQYDSSVTMLTSLNGPQFNIRGAEATRYVDGFYQSMGLDDPVSVERIEVLEGATAILYGVSSPGGIVNTISKKPLFTDAADLGSFFGSGGFYRFDADVNFVPPDTDKIGFRVMGAYAANQEYGWINDWHGKEKFIDPTVTWRPTDKTNINVSFESYENDSTPLGQVIRYGTAGDPPDLNFGVEQNFKGPASWQTINEIDWRGELEQQLWPGWVLRAAASYYHYVEEKDELGNIGRIAANGYDQVVAPRHYLYDDFDTSGQAELVGHFDLGPLNNRLLVGYEKTAQENTEYEFSSRVDTTLDLDDLDDPSSFPSLGIFPQDYPVASVNTKLNVDYGAWYAATQTWFLDHHGLLLLGVRGDTADSTSASRLPGGKSTSIANTRPSPQAGLSYRVISPVNVYVLYSTSMYPNTVTDQFGQPFAPQLASNLEAGVKGDFWKGRLSFSSSVFQLTQSNIAELSPFTPGIVQYHILSGKNQSRGAEIQGLAGITSHWQLLFGYTYLDARVVDDTQTPAAVGTVSNYSPRHSARLWTRYNFTQAGLAGAWVGAGMVYQSVEFAGTPSSIPFQGFHVYNLAAGYRFHLHRHVLSLQFNLNNVLNEAYVADPDAYGAPRTFYGEVKLKY